MPFFGIGSLFCSGLCSRYMPAPMCNYEVVAISSRCA